MAVVNELNKAVATRNLAAFVQLVERLVGRKRHLSAMGCFFGPTGAGKTKSATFAATRYTAAHVMCHQYTTAKSMLTSILQEYGVRKPRGAITNLIDEAILVMAGSPERPLIIDEAQYVAHKRFANIIYHLSDMARSPVILMGEETLPTQLETFERVSGRMLETIGAVPCDLQDFRLLAKSLCPNVSISDELAGVILKETRGNTRKIVNNLARVEELAAQDGRDNLDLPRFGGPAAVMGARPHLPRRVA